MVLRLLSLNHNIKQYNISICSWCCACSLWITTSNNIISLFILSSIYYLDKDKQDYLVQRIFFVNVCRYILWICSGTKSPLVLIFGVSYHIEAGVSILTILKRVFLRLPYWGGCFLPYWGGCKKLASVVVGTSSASHKRRVKVALIDSPRQS